MNIKLCAIIPVYNNIDDTVLCINNLKKFIIFPYFVEIIVVDDGSSDGTSKIIQDKFPEVHILVGDGNLWWAGGINKGLEYVQSKIQCEYILLLNNDTIFEFLTLKNLLETIISSGNKVVCSSVVVNIETRKIHNAGQKMSMFLKELLPIHHGKDLNDIHSLVIECDSVGSRFVLMPRRIIDDIGYFNNKKFPHNYSDFEYFLRAKLKGYKILTVMNSVIYTKINSIYMYYFIKNSSMSEYFDSYFNTKNVNNIKLLFNKAFAHKNIVVGVILLNIYLLRNLKFFFVKLLK